MQSFDSTQEASNQIPVNAIAQTPRWPGSVGLNLYLCPINVMKGHYGGGGVVASCSPQSLRLDLGEVV